MTARYRLRYMVLADIPQVVEIDKLSFPMPWSSRSYLFEITDNKSSHMIVVEATANHTPPQGLQAWWKRFTGRTSSSSPASMILGYGGFWFIDGESHISTIAVHPDRGQGLGEVLLSGMLARSLEIQAEYAVLEVRVGNASAINLYKKYEFEVVGQRKGYYRDNNEDAYLMHCAPLDKAYRQRFAERMQRLRETVDYEYALNDG